MSRHSDTAQQLLGLTLEVRRPLRDVLLWPGFWRLLQPGHGLAHNAVTVRGVRLLVLGLTLTAACGGRTDVGLTGVDGGSTATAPATGSYTSLSTSTDSNPAGTAPATVTTTAVCCLGAPPPHPTPR